MQSLFGCVQAVSMPYAHSPQDSVDNRVNERIEGAFSPNGEKEPFFEK